MGRMPSFAAKTGLDSFRVALGADVALLLAPTGPGRLAVRDRAGAAHHVPDEVLAPTGSLLARLVSGDHQGPVLRLPLLSASSGRTRPLGPAIVLPVGGGEYVVLARRHPKDPFGTADLERARWYAANDAPAAGGGYVDLADATFRQAFDRAAVGMSIVDTTLVYRWVNVPLCEMLGRAREELVGLAAVDTVHPEHAGRAVAFFDRLRRGEAEAVRDRFRFQRPDGTTVWADVGGSVVRSGMRSPLILVQQFDVTAEQDLTAELAYRAMHDELTRLANRALLRDRLQSLLARARRNGSQAVVFYLDLDRFKAVNDTYGHATGDTVLVETARRLALIVRAGDTVARVGGDEFVVAGETADIADATQLARRISDALRPPVQAEGRTIPVAACIGVATSRPDDTPESLIARADHALLRAKRLGTLHVVPPDST